jgi:hypothetical protein
VRRIGADGSPGSGRPCQVHEQVDAVGLLIDVGRCAFRLGLSGEIEQVVLVATSSRMNIRSSR